MRFAMLLMVACGGDAYVENANITATQAPLSSGSYFGAGAFKAIVLGNVSRPFPAHWQIDGDVYVGSYPIVNSQPIYMRRSGNDLLDANGDKQGTMTCDGASCDIDFAFESNAPLGDGRTTQKYKATWLFDGAGFHETATLSFRWFPLIGTMHAEADFSAE